MRIIFFRCPRRRRGISELLQQILTNLPAHPLDDCIIAAFFARQGIYLIPHNYRIGVYSIEAWNEMKSCISPELFQFHVKTSQNNPDQFSLRMQGDLMVHSELFDLFYGFRLFGNQKDDI